MKELKQVLYDENNEMIPIESASGRVKSINAALGINESNGISRRNK
jgi:hypothetical protein